MPRALARALQELVGDRERDGLRGAVGRLRRRRLLAQLVELELQDAGGAQIVAAGADERPCHRPDGRVEAGERRRLDLHERLRLEEAAHDVAVRLDVRPDVAAEPDGADPDWVDRQLGRERRISRRRQQRAERRGEPGESLFGDRVHLLGPARRRADRGDDLAPVRPRPARAHAARTSMRARRRGRARALARARPLREQDPADRRALRRRSGHTTKSGGRRVALDDLHVRLRSDRQLDQLPHQARQLEHSDAD